MGYTRYTVEQGTDGSWLVIDHGTHGDQRHAITRDTDRRAAQLQASTFANLDHLIQHTDRGTSDPADIEVDALVADYSAKIDAAYNFNHLLA